MPPRLERALAPAAFITVCLVWGTTYLAIRIAVQAIPPMLLTSMDFLIAGAILTCIAVARGERIPRDRRTIANLVFVGFLMVCVANLAIIWGEQWVPSGFAALFVATAPFWMALLELLRPNGERHTARSVIGMMIGFAGVAMLVTPKAAGGSYNVHFVIGALVMQVGSVAWQLGSLRSKHQLQHVALLSSASLQMLFGGILVGIAGIATGELARVHFTTRAVAALAYQSVFGSVVGYSAYLYALAHMPTSKVSLYAYVNPVVAVVLGGLILGEPLTWLSITAMIVILGGVAVVQSAKIRGKGNRVPEPASEEMHVA